MLMQKRVWKIVLHLCPALCFLLWFCIARYEENHPLPQYDLFRFLLILLLYAAAVSLLVFVVQAGIAACWMKKGR